MLLGGITPEQDAETRELHASNAGISAALALQETMNIAVQHATTAYLHGKLSQEGLETIMNARQVAASEYVTSTTERNTELLEFAIRVRSEAEEDLANLRSTSNNTDETETPETNND